MKISIKPPESSLSTFAVVQNGVVVNLGVSLNPLDETWILASNPAVSIGWNYDPVNGFRPPLQDGGPYPPASSLTFLPFSLSLASDGLNVSLSNGILQVGCQYYNATLAQAAITALLSGQVTEQGIYLATDVGIRQGQFTIATVDCQSILSALQNAQSN